jgi:hypothetical protein
MIRGIKFMRIYSVLDDNFKQYGKIIKHVGLDGIVSAMEKTPIPDGVDYVASDPSLESTDFAKAMEKEYYGNLSVQVGWCNGHNQKLNALEYHRSSEVDVACTDIILLLGKKQDINEDFTYDTSNVEAFFVNAGTAVELYETTLHYAPCGVDGAGFKCAVVLPKGTNGILKVAKEGVDDDKILTATNKWLIAHKDAHIKGAFAGLKGENIEV